MAFDPYHEWLGIPPEEQPADHYRLLSISQFETSPKVIETAADRQMGHLRNYQSGKHSALSQKLLNEVSAARVCLLNAEKKAAYDQKLRAQLKARQKAIPTAKPLEAEPAAKPVDAGLEKLFEKASHGPAVGKAVSARNKQTQMWTAVGIVGVGLLAVVFILIRVTGSSSSKPTTPGPVPVARNDPPDAPKAPTLTKKPTEPEERQPETPVKTTSDPAPAQGETNSPPVVTAPQPVPPGETAPVAPAPPTIETPSRLPVPTGEDQAKVAAQLKELFELDKDRAPAERKKLAADLAGLAGKSEKPAERYVLLVTAAKLSCQAGDGNAALRAVDKLAEAFDVDSLALKASLIKKLAAEAGDSAAIGALLDASDKVIDAAMAQDKYDVALELVEEAYKACAQGTGREHRKRAYDRRKEVQTLAASWQKVQAILEKLKTSPDDPEANLAAGRYYCFDQGDWDKGLPCLAKGSDAELKKLAEEELNGPPADSAAMMKLADAWWDLAESRKDTDHDGPLLRAGTWYREAQPAITSTLVKAKVDKRLEDIKKLGRSIPEPAQLGPPPPAVAPFNESQAKHYQQRWAKYLGVPVEATNSIGMKLVLIPPGEFEMGSTEAEQQLAVEEAKSVNDKVSPGAIVTEGPRHRVRLTRAFALSRHEVTRGQFRQFVKETGYKTDAERGGDGGTGVVNGKGTRDPKYIWSADPGFQQTDDDPVVNVSWKDARAFCKWLSTKQGGVLYDLPTEAQWEYACRAGTTAYWCCGDNDTTLAEYAWFNVDSGRKTQPVGKKKPNSWGLFDMHGNAWEWCADRWATDYYARSALSNPTGPRAGECCVRRGGSWNSRAWGCRSASRIDYGADHCTCFIGFRVAMEIPERPADGASQVPISAGRTAAVPTNQPAPPPAVAPFDAAQAKAHQQAWAKHLGTPVETTNSIGMKLVLIPPGEFEMGLTEDGLARLVEDAKRQKVAEWYFGRAANSVPRHRVRISEAFYLGTCEVTQAKYERVMGDNPSRFKDNPNRPVEMVSWDEAVKFCRALSELPDEKAAGAAYRLPTEAEWEYACRAGTQTRYCFGDDEALLDRWAWMDKNSQGHTQPVGQRQPSAWRLYDMHGNVWEWCADWFAEDYYKVSPADDPPGADSGTLRVLRGGSWGFAAPAYFACAFRGNSAPATRFPGHGFRVVRTLAH